MSTRRTPGRPAQVWEGSRTVAGVYHNPMVSYALDAEWWRAYRVCRQPRSGLRVASVVSGVKVA